MAATGPERRRRWEIGRWALGWALGRASTGRRAAPPVVGVGSLGRRRSVGELTGAEAAVRSGGEPVRRDGLDGDDGGDGFARHVLELAPTATVVVDASGSIVYANRAMVELAGWAVDADEDVAISIFDHIHPDDIGWIAEAFVALAGQQMDGRAVLDRPWAPINFRIVSRTGDVVPVEVVGRDALDRPEIDGIIYEIRPGHERDIFQRVLAGVAMGGDVVHQLDLIMDLLAATAVDIEAAVVLHRRDGAAEVVTASLPSLRESLSAAAATGSIEPFDERAEVPAYHAVDELSGPVGEALADLGFVDVWHVDVAIPVIDDTYRIVATTPIRHVAAMGLIDRLNRAAELAAVVLLRVRAERLLAHAAHHDPLTDLPNRLGLKRLVGLMEPGGRDFAVLFVDLDDFKEINDVHGHSIGDRVLQVVADRLRSVIRSTDVIARLGGDEFAIVLGPSATTPSTPEGARDLAERVLASLSQPIDVDGTTHAVSASIGFVAVDAATDIEVAVAGADRAMYVAKRAGGGRAHEGLEERFRRRADDP